MVADWRLAGYKLAGWRLAGQCEGWDTEKVGVTG